MYTVNGKSLINSTISSSGLATHLVLGIDEISGQKYDLHEKYPFTVPTKILPIASSTVVDSSIIFSSESTQAGGGDLIANSIALVRIRDSGSERRFRPEGLLRPLDSQFLPTAVSQGITYTSPTADGLIRISNGAPIKWTGNLDLSMYDGSDWITFPVFFSATPSAGATLSVTIQYIKSYTTVDKIVNPVLGTATYSMIPSITPVGAETRSKFTNIISGVAEQGVVGLNTYEYPEATSFAFKLSSLSNWSELQTKLGTITSVSFGWTGTSPIYIGVVHILPNSNDNAWITIARKVLSEQLIVSTDNNRYYSAEYILDGI
jgi:hypothetical protein